MNSARSNYRGIENSTGNPEILKGGLDAFLVKWRSADKELAESEKRVRASGWNKTPAAGRALAEADLGRVRTLFNSARAFSGISGAETGLYYLGTATASLESAVFTKSLALPASAAPRARSIAPEIQVLQNKILAAYQPPRSIDHHPDFIRLNAALKFAGELDSAKSYYGAQYQYIEALRMFALLTTESDPPSIDKLRADESGAAARIKAKDADHSIAELLLEKAQYRLTKAEADPKDIESRRSAHAILSAAIPAYFAVLESPVAPTLVVGRVATVTLVRWPYT